MIHGKHRKSWEGGSGMKRHTGNHGAQRQAARAEPSPLTALRDMLATAFAADIVAVTREVCEVLRSEIQAEAEAAKRGALRHALVGLARQSGELPLAIIDRVRSRFDAKLVPGADEFSRTSRLQAAGLSLLSEASLQAEIALDNCSARLREQSSPEIFQLTARVCDMLGVESIADAANPVMPRVLAGALLEAIASLGLEEEAKLLAFKAYGPALVHIAPDLYRHANSLLEELGVLPGFTAHYGKPRKAQGPKLAPSRPAMQAGPALATLFERLMNGERVLGAGRDLQTCL